MVKIKEEVGYERSPCIDYKGGISCDMCENHRYYEIKGLGGASLGMQHRCKIIGDNPSRKYAIRPDYKCKCFEKKTEEVEKD